MTTTRLLRVGSTGSQRVRFRRPALRKLSARACVVRCFRFRYPSLFSHPNLSPAARRVESPERLAQVTRSADPPSMLPAVGHTPRAAQPKGSVHVPHSMSFTAAAPDGEGAWHLHSRKKVDATVHVYWRPRRNNKTSVLLLDLQNLGDPIVYSNVQECEKICYC